MITFIFNSYLQGLRYKPIIQMLKDNRVPSPMENEVWCQSTIETILTNEKYTGDNLLQKTLYRKPFRSVEYELGRVNQYLVRNNHPGIISKERFDLILKIREKNTKKRHEVEEHIISTYAYYFYSVDLENILIESLKDTRKSMKLDVAWNQRW